MKLLREDIIRIGDFIFKDYRVQDLYQKAAHNGVTLTVAGVPGMSETIDSQSFKDLAATYSISQHAQTVVVPSDLIRQFIGMADKMNKNEIPWLLPFNDTIVQFSAPIDEGEFFIEKEYNRYQLENNITDDTVVGLMLGRHLNPASTRWLHTAIAVYGTMSVNRVAWWEDTGEFNTDNPATATNPNKLRILGVSLALVLFLNAENVHLERHDPDPAVNRKREKKGKRKIEPYHTVYIHKQDFGASRPSGTGTEHSYCYGVRRHLRRYKNGSTVWIAPHLRGIAHINDPIPQRIYKVVKPKENGDDN